MLQIEISLRDLAGFVKHTGIEISMTLGYPDFESKLAMARSIGENDRLDFVKPVLKGRPMGLWTGICNTPGCYGRSFPMW